MTDEELEKYIQLMAMSRPQINQTMNYNAPIGQQIAYVDKIEAHFDKDMGMQIAMANELKGVGNAPDEQQEQPLENYIFSHTIFTTNAKVVSLRDVIGARIKGARLFRESNFAKSRPMIEPTSKNQWYYIWKMLNESKLLENTATVRSFVKQMIEWYPEVFGDIANELQRDLLMKNMENSISGEKKLWMKNGQEIPFNDMSYAWKQQGINYKKYQAMIHVCRDLRNALRDLCNALRDLCNALKEVNPTTGVCST